MDTDVEDNATSTLESDTDNSVQSSSEQPSKKKWRQSSDNSEQYKNLIPQRVSEFPEKLEVLNIYALFLTVKGTRWSTEVQSL